ncbi:MAG: CPCC family cysteine-rich protein [Bacillaceae bacterium]
MEKFTCPCCGYKTFIFETGDICQICFWEDDQQQRENPDLENATNHTSLRQAQKDFIEGRNINRHPSEKDIKDVSWKPLPQVVSVC